MQVKFFGDIDRSRYRSIVLVFLAMAQLALVSVEERSTLRLVHPPNGEERTRSFVSLMWMPDRGGRATAYELELDGHTQIVAGATTFDTVLL